LGRSAVTRSVPCGLLLAAAVLVVRVGISSADRALEYSVVDQVVLDTPAKAEVAYHLVVKGDITRATLEELLTRLHHELSARPSSYHGKMTHVWLYAYRTAELARARTAQWLAMLERVGANAQPRIRIDEGRLAALGAPETKKFGLSEQQRRQAWDEIRVGVEHAARTAEQEFPGPSTKQQIERERQLAAAAKARVAKKYGLSSKQMHELYNEANRKGWQWPK
jgi:hypothetical protein